MTKQRGTAIDFAEGLTLPLEIASSPIAFLAQRGRGKSRGAMGLACAFHDAGVPPITIDAAGVWWGLRLAANGRDRGLDIPVLGGLHGDAPLLPTGGKVLAEALVRTGQGCVIDTTGFDTEAEKKRFVTDFAEVFYRAKMKARSPVHLFLEESDEWVPEQPGPDEARMLGAFQRITRLGRNFGIGITFITHRPQGLSKKVLNLAEVVITLGMSGSHEIKAMKAWMDDQAVDATQREEALAKIPRLGWNKFEKKDHGALIWAPLLNLFHVVKIKAPRTFDSSATPEVGGAAEVKALPALDLEALTKAMAATAEEAQANDPKLLRAEIARLRAAVATAARERATGLTEPARVEVPVVPEGVLAASRRAAELARALQGKVYDVGKTLEEAAIAVANAAQEVVRETNHVPNVAPARAATTRGARARRDRNEAAILSDLDGSNRPREKRGRGSGDPKLGGGERKILTVLAQYGQRTKKALAILTGYAPGGGAFNNNLAALRTAGYITGYDLIEIADSGLVALGQYEPLPTGGKLREYWLGKLEKADRLALGALIWAYPSSLTKEEIAARAGYEPGGGAFNNGLSRLRTLGLIHGKGELTASETLFDEAGP